MRLRLRGEDAGRGIRAGRCAGCRAASSTGCPRGSRGRAAGAGAGAPQRRALRSTTWSCSRPHLDRTIAALSAAGLELRRVREEPTPAGAPRQAFFRLGEVILEVVQAPAEADRAGRRRGAPGAPVGPRAAGGGPRERTSSGWASTPASRGRRCSRGRQIATCAARPGSRCARADEPRAGARLLSGAAMSEQSLDRGRRVRDGPRGGGGRGAARGGERESARGAAADSGVAAAGQAAAPARARTRGAPHPRARERSAATARSGSHARWRRGAGWSRSS